jgi:ABC-type glycerol-3-phosphate transport system substrate-binding protein
VITFDQWFEYASAVNKPADDLTERVFGSAHFVPNWNSMNNYMSDPFVLGADGRQCVGTADTEEWVHAWQVMKNAHREELMPEVLILKNG